MSLRSRQVRTVVATGIALVSVVVVAGVHGAGKPTGPVAPAALSASTHERVITLLRAPTGQSGGQTTQSDQVPLITQLKAAGATDITQYHLVNGFAATMTGAERDQLAGDPRVAAVLPDLPVRLGGQPNSAPAYQAGPAAAGPTPTPPTPAAPTPSTTLPPGLCPADPNKPLLEPEALQVTNAVPAQAVANGQGTKIAYLADNVDTANPDFVRPDGAKVFVDYQDFTGEGTATAGDGREAFGDASTIAAQGRQRYDLADFTSGNPLPKGCTIRILGMAPGASLVGLKVVASNGFGATSAVLQAIDYAVTVDHVNVLNESLGGNPYPDRDTDPFTLANRAAVAAGTTVVSSAGDAGYGNTVGNPASDPTVITVGASTTYRLQAQVRNQLPGLAGWTNDNVSAISSSGVAENGRVDDLMAPGDEGWALCTADPKRFQGCVNFRGRPSPIQAFGGTSEAAPLVAGVAALVIEAYQNTHAGARPTPALVKQILTSTATDEYDPADRQGAGLLNALAAVRAAQGTSGLLFDTGQSAGQFTATAAPGAPQDFDLRVTNAGATAQTVGAHGRVLSTVSSDQRGAIALDTTAPTPDFRGPGGTLDDYVTQPFTVPAGADHLDASIAWPAPTGPAIAMAVLDPKGDLAGYTLPQATQGPDFGHVDVHTPMPGAWHALIYGRRAASGFTGLVSYRFTTTRYAPFGTVTPGSLVLAPGQSGLLRISATTPARPGDQVAAVELDTATGQRFALPVVLRSLVPADGAGTFAGTITGGNGRGGSPAQQNTYWFDIPGGERDADIDITLAGDVRQQVYGFLVSPDGQLLSQATNVRAMDAGGNPTAFTDSLRSVVRDPRPGRWSYLVVVANPVSGSTTDEAFTGRLRFDQVDVTAQGVPNSAGQVLPAGVPRTVTVRVHNTAATPESFFVDPRANSMTDLRLAPGDGSASGLRLRPFAQATYLVPTETTGLVGVTSGSAPVTADLVAGTGQPEVFGTPGPDNTAVAYLDSPAVSPGSWLLQADPVGPFGGSSAANTANGTADLELIAHTLAFDPAVTSSTGDTWQASTHGPTGTPLTVAADQTGTITVTVKPAAPKGTVVSGFLYLDALTGSTAANPTANPTANLTADELIAIPYSYAVG